MNIEAVDTSFSEYITLHITLISRLVYTLPSRPMDKKSWYNAPSPGKLPGPLKNMTPETNTTPIKLCPTCGTRVKEDATRCLVCGADLTTTEKATQSSKVVQGSRMPSITLSLPAAIGLISIIPWDRGNHGVFCASRRPLKRSFHLQRRSTITATATGTQTATITPLPTLTNTPEPSLNTGDLSGKSK